ncbi:hypothetical protein KBY65_13105 [Cyanobium sp. Alchichica 3B3-8F6]|uniref:hypothetical protein n=1 Tax=Synechococcales TaxID=1890424 RepID=UPI00117E9258|nr:MULTISPECIES: hypothetical protein [Synechococcales]MCP9883394.1 hypothetical protein [Cyanobium sp. Alchichica 3B3-8F6]
MQISSCCIRRYTVGSLPKEREALVAAITEINNDNAGIDEYDEYSLYRLFEDVDNELYFDGPEFNDGDIDLELDDGSVISLRTLLHNGATIKSLGNVDATISADNLYCCTDQQGSGEIDFLECSDTVQEIIHTTSQALDLGNEKKSLANGLVLLTKTWRTPWDELTMFVGITTSEDSDPDFRDHWGDGSYSMDVNSEEAAIYSMASGQWNLLPEVEILPILETAGISISDWSEQASYHNINNFRSAMGAGGYGFGLVPFVQDAIKNFALTVEEVREIKNQSSDDATITACVAYQLGYDPIIINLPDGCKYEIQIFEPTDEGATPKSLSSQQLLDSIFISKIRIDYRNADGNLLGYTLSYHCTECMVDLSITGGEQNGARTIRLNQIRVSIPLIEEYELQEKDSCQFVSDETYSKRLAEWKELRDAATRNGCINIVTLDLKQTVEYSWLKI